MFDYSNYYYIVFGIQGLCLFHAYKNHSEQKWYWIIIFFPLIGCLIYAYDNFYNRSNIDNLTEGVKVLVYNNYALDKLEKEVKYSETFTNKTNLAEAYTERGRYDEAIKLYESCQKGNYENNPDLLRKMLGVYFLQKNYPKAVAIGQRLESAKTLIGDSDDKIAYAWALHYTEQTEKAEQKFKELDAPFANFQARLEFSKFLIAIGRSAEAAEKLKAIVGEHDAMESYEKNSKRHIAREAKRLLQNIK